MILVSGSSNDSSQCAKYPAIRGTAINCGGIPIALCFYPIQIPKTKVSGKDLNGYNLQQLVIKNLLDGSNL